MVAYPALLVSQKIPVDEDAILPYFPNLVEAVPSKLNATPFGMAHRIMLYELQGRTQQVKCDAICHGTPHYVA
jgi:hypothetical protein